MKKIKLLLLFISTPLVLSSCGNGASSIEEPTWQFSATMHWQTENGVKINQGTHRFSDWTIESNPTCDKDGTKYQTCNVCQYKKIEPLPKLGHSYGEWVTTPEGSERTCSTCGNVEYAKREQSISFKKLYNGETIDLCDPTIRDLITHKDDEEYVATYLMLNRSYSTGKTHDNQTYIDIDIIDSKVRNTSYTLTLATDEDFEQVIDSYVTTSKSVRLDGILTPGTTYYYKVDCADGDYSVIDNFVTLDSPVRYINCGTVNNVRDLGGHETIDGKHVKYGLIYRGAGLNDSNISVMNAKSRQVLAKLGMKGELDLRENASTSNAWDPSLPHLCVNGGWYSYLYDTQPKIDALRESLMFLSNLNNYPSYFHCSYGMDRTGTLAYILLGLLGVSENDLYLDYELTDFSSVASTHDSHCERAVIVPSGPGNYSFDYTASAQPDGETLRTPVYRCIQHFKNTYKANTLQESIERYLLERVELSQTTIDKLKANLLA